MAYVMINKELQGIHTGLSGRSSFFNR